MQSHVIMKMHLYTLYWCSILTYLLFGILFQGLQCNKGHGLEEIKSVLSLIIWISRMMKLSYT